MAQHYTTAVASAGDIGYVIERATPEMSGRLTEIAHASKAYWRYPERYLRAWKDELTFRPEFIAENPVFVVRKGSEVVACCAVVTAGARASLEHLWVLPEAIGTGAGRKLFEHAADCARRAGARELEIVSDPYAAGFYVRMGARKTGERHGELEGRPRILPIYTFTL